MPALSRAGPLLLRAGVTAAALWLAWRVGGAVAGGPGGWVWHPAWIGPIALVHLIVLWLLSARLGLMLRTLGRPDPPARDRLRATAAGLGLSQVAIGSVGGDAGRAALLARGGLGWPEALRAVVLDRVLGLAGLVALGLGALAALPGGARPALGLASGLALAAGAGILAVRQLAPLPARREAGRLGRDLAALGRRGGGWACLGLAVLSHGLSAVLFLLCARLVGLSVPPLATFVAVPAGLLAATAPVSLGGWGVREASVAAAFRATAPDFAQAVEVSVLFGVSHVAAGALFLVWLAWSPGDRSSPRRDGM